MVVVVVGGAVDDVWLDTTRNDGIVAVAEEVGIEDVANASDDDDDADAVADVVDDNWWFAVDEEDCCCCCC